uniref:Uncharacterized protein n=1 Tax=Salix viminalis TaxID=40686 RepID=A0A6N2M0X6_SALVM
MSQQIFRRRLSSKHSRVTVELADDSDDSSSSSSMADETNSHYDDIIVYRGQAYVANRLGTVYWMDSSLNVIQYSPPLYGCGS